MEQSPSKISESSFDDFKRVKAGEKASGMAAEYDYDPSEYEEGEDDYLYPDRHSPPQSVVPTAAPSMKNTPIRLWKVWRAKSLFAFAESREMCKVNYKTLDLPMKPSNILCEMT